MKPLRLTLAAILLASGSAQAVEFKQFLAEQSTLQFVSRQMGVPVDGHFRKFAATLAFDPTRPAAATAKLELDLASVDAGSLDADGEVVGKPWFNVKAYPTATFVSSAIRPLGGDQYELTGKLTIKGKTQQVSAPFTFRQAGGNGVFDGTFVLKRLDFALGDGIWSDLSTVANDVQIRFHIVAAAAAGGK
ncbi:YceI family protein [Candidatus Accumulibacter sp. ACC003]|uniref:YceI family protein n=1 Tax=Candidatus Accumulibacter sp. ACC003 TaxID=2823334 RepID=UPI0025C2ED4C|nr:YceI family protein [Candidatus Accumulibacter sp. ACC003]